MITAKTAPPKSSIGMHGFDFLHGNWRVRHRRLRDRLAGCSEWEEFGGTMRCAPILGGLGTLDENLVNSADGPYHACTLRLYDRARDDWSIQWTDGRTRLADPPLHGRFDGPIGEFSGSDVLRGSPVRARYRWRVLGRTEARWEQAFAPGGTSGWETNWIMEFERT